MESFHSLNFFSKARIHVLLFIATFLTTYYVNGLWYSITIMMILLSHELGHFFMCRKYHVAATMPYFLPLPLPPFGTFGAVIKMKGHIPDKRALFDIGATGPIMGLVFSIPAIIIGLILSDVRPVPSDTSQYLDRTTTHWHGYLSSPSCLCRLGRTLCNSAQSASHRTARRRTHIVCLIRQKE